MVVVPGWIGILSLKCLVRLGGFPEVGQLVVPGQYEMARVGSQVLGSDHPPFLLGQ